jgi:plastocyanin
MKTKAISSIFLLFTIAVGIISMSPASFADHSEVTITPISGSGSSSGCELTEEGCYNPSIATVDVGGVVTFSNTDSVSHTFSSGVPSDDVIGTEFNSGMLAPGDSAEWIPENIGEFSYFDMIHPWMQGTIIVQEAAAEEPVVVEEVVEEPVVVEEVVEEPVVVEEVVEEPVVATQESTEEGGGCLIATAAYGSELAPQVQMLREIRDNQLMNTESGSAFMTGFNELYYTFSPTIADMERESPVFKEIVKAGLTPMLSTLAIMDNAESESEVLGLGLSVIALNLGMYIGLPAFGIIKVIQLRKN